MEAKDGPGSPHFHHWYGTVRLDDLSRYSVPSSAVGLPVFVVRQVPTSTAFQPLGHAPLGCAWVRANCPTAMFPGRGLGLLGRALSRISSSLARPSGQRCPAARQGPTARSLRADGVEPALAIAGQADGVAARRISR